MKKTRNRFEAAWQSKHPHHEYETIKLAYTIEHTYTPDFIDQANSTIYETKGFFDATSRAKMLAVKRAHPGWKIVLVFQKPNIKISRRSSTTYWQWAEKNGFDWQSFK